MTNSTVRTFKSAWWSVELPEGWVGTEEKECVTFRRSGELGVLQLSAARKDQGAVTDQDLKEFAQPSLSPHVQLHPVSYERFSGFDVEYQRQGFFWREWWLRSTTLMVYATYNVASERSGLESVDIDKIIRSLRPN